MVVTKRKNDQDQGLERFTGLSHGLSCFSTNRSADFWDSWSPAFFPFLAVVVAPRLHNDIIKNN